jgi:hypothetical protein
MTWMTLTPPTFAQQSDHPTVVQSLIDLFRPRRHSSGTRGTICLITPGYDNEHDLWSDRPLFLWKGTVGRIEVRQADTDTVIWDQALLPNHHSLIYQGPPLQPGQTYTIVFFSPSGQLMIKDPDFYPRFRILEAARRTQIATELAQEVWQQQAVTPEAIAIAEAVYFSRQELWSDALQTVYDASQRSPSLGQFMQTAQADACGES